MYYLLIGSGLALAGAVQHLGWVLLACGSMVLLVSRVR